MNHQIYLFAPDFVPMVLKTDYDELMAYCDKLVDFLPCLPKDVENLREANAHFAEENERLQSKLYVAEQRNIYLKLALQREQENSAHLQNKLDAIKKTL